MAKSKKTATRSGAEGTGEATKAVASGRGSGSPLGFELVEATA
jgi:hypothetical protein